MSVRFHIYILASVILLQLLASQYVLLNDLAVYGAALEGGWGVYEGDYAFELLQHTLKIVLGAELVIYGMQMVLLALVVTYIYIIRGKISGVTYTIAFLIFSSPVVIVGLTNSIRQSLAFVLILLALELRNLIWRLGLLSLAILMHKASLLLIPLLLIICNLKNWRLISLKKIDLRWILATIFLGILVFPWYVNEIVDFFYSVFDRYSIYIYSAVVFTEGRVGSEKLVIWAIFWTMILLALASIKPERLVSSSLIVPLIYTLLLAIDSYLRGFDEFHSRLLMFNNVFVLAWLIESVKSHANKHFCCFVVLVFNLLNPTTIGVLV